MYQVGDMVIYGCSGVCRIAARGTLPFGAVGEEYYVLHPISFGSIVYVPVANGNLVQKMHPVLGREELLGILSAFSGEPREWIDSEATRKRLYLEVLESGDRSALLAVLQTLRSRRDRLNRLGKRLRLSDERLLRDAERVLYDEISFVLEIPRKEAEAYLLGSLSCV